MTLLVGSCDLKIVSEMTEMCRVGC